MLASADTREAPTVGGINLETFEVVIHERSCPTDLAPDLNGVPAAGAGSTTRRPCAPPGIERSICTAGVRGERACSLERRLLISVSRANRIASTRRSR
jgi:hypothetical protein